MTERRSRWPRGLRLQLVYWGCWFESLLGHTCLSVVSIVYCEVEVSGSG